MGILAFCSCSGLSSTSLKSPAKLSALEVSLQTLSKRGLLATKKNLRTKGVSMRAKFMMSSVNDHIFPTIINTSIIYKCLERLRYVGDAESKCLDRRETKE